MEWINDEKKRTDISNNDTNICIFNWYSNNFYFNIELFATDEQKYPKIHYPRAISPKFTFCIITFDLSLLSPFRYFFPLFSKSLTFTRTKKIKKYLWTASLTVNIPPNKMNVMNSRRLFLPFVTNRRLRNRLPIWRKDKWVLMMWTFRQSKEKWSK